MQAFPISLVSALGGSPAPPGVAGTSGGDDLAWGSPGNSPMSPPPSNPPSLPFSLFEALTEDGPPSSPPVPSALAPMAPLQSPPMPEAALDCAEFERMMLSSGQQTQFLPLSSPPPPPPPAFAANIPALPSFQQQAAPSWPGVPPPSPPMPSALSPRRVELLGRSLGAGASFQALDPALQFELQGPPMVSLPSDLEEEEGSNVQAAEGVDPYFSPAPAAPGPRPQFPPGLSPPLGTPNHGSVLHSLGQCRPCAWYWKKVGCQRGENCDHCHFCPEGESKARKKAKQVLIRSCMTSPQPQHLQPSPMPALPQQQQHPALPTLPPPLLPFHQVQQSPPPMGVPPPMMPFGASPPPAVEQTRKMRDQAKAAHEKRVFPLAQHLSGLDLKVGSATGFSDPDQESTTGAGSEFEPAVSSCFEDFVE